MLKKISNEEMEKVTGGGGTNTWICQNSGKQYYESDKSTNSCENFYSADGSVPDKNAANYTLMTRCNKCMFCH